MNGTACSVAYASVTPAEILLGMKGSKQGDAQSCRDPERFLERDMVILQLFAMAVMISLLSCLPTTAVSSAGSACSSLYWTAFHMAILCTARARETTLDSLSLRETH